MSNYTIDKDQPLNEVVNTSRELFNISLNNDSMS